jgi:ArsR family transcriptional regulator, arsenate/arsenite/antimonite-responsive transcriptional repressor
MKPRQMEDAVSRYADMFAAMGNDARLRIVRLLLSSHPEGMVVGDIQAELGIPNSTLSHHLEKLRHEELVEARRDGSFLWYSARADSLEELLTFLYAECCTRNKAVRPDAVVQPCNALRKGAQRC